jgi:hypothetical protein
MPPARRPLKERFDEKVGRGSGCWLWTAARDPNGYGRINGDRRNRGVLAHRLSYQLYRGPIPPGMYVLHRCDNPSCVRPGHLFLGTQADNVADMNAKRRHWRFADAPEKACLAVKLSWRAVRTIRRRVAAGEVQRRLAREYGVSPATLCRIIKGKAWKDIP